MTHIARERETRQMRQGSLTDAFRLDAQLARALLKEVAHEQRDILVALTQ
ncbi:hypothetical protein PEP31012_04667 [Pandoraea eparura]|uniref:Uncharacterized protein n=1 Tax=Pandoraea eparura TaxID=2508291 RepID=A0A5E4YPR0_9BURK|nr:hypothetical protein PEP31012_04667 [Pandoraea eparura]